MLYSIGHGNKSKEEFLSELREFGVEYLIDVRSKPYSKYYPHFNQPDLKFYLESHGIQYVFLGEQLGGLPGDRTCYNHEGKVDYSIVKEKPFFIEGLQRLINAHQNNIPVAVMCSEGKPQDCHRSKLIGNELLNRNIRMVHITGLARTKDQETVVLEANKGRGERDLFDVSNQFTSRKSYH